MSRRPEKPFALSGWLLAAILIAPLASLVDAHHGAPVKPTKSPAAARYLALIVVDGFRPDYASLAPMPHLKELMASGTTYTRAWVGQLESQTPTGHATLATGVYPRKHGVIGFGWRDPATGSFTWMPTDLRQLDAGRMEKLIESSGVPTLSQLLHRQEPGATSASLSGEKYYAADALGAGADYILYGKRRDRQGLHGMSVAAIGRHLPPRSQSWQVGFDGPAYPYAQDELVGRLGARLVEAIRPRMLLVNLPGTDIQGHISGGVTDPEHMRPVISHVDQAIGDIMAAYRRVHLYSQTLFVVTADHGMVPNSHIVPIKAMYGEVRKTGVADLEDDLLTTAGYIYLRDAAHGGRVAAGFAPGRFPQVEGALYRPPGAHSTFRADAATARALGPSLTHAYVDLSNTLAGPDGPDVVLPYSEDAMGLTVAGSTRWGNHGGLSWRVQHIPLVISGPGVRHGVSTFPAQLIDVAPTVEHAFGWSVPSGVDGVVLADAFRQAPSAAIQDQARAGRARLPDVSALLLHSAQQHALTLVGSSTGHG